MERIAYKIALDVTKPESQKSLTGFSIGESRARVLKISLMNGRIPIHFDGTETVSMFVTKPSDASPSIGLCYLEGDTIIYNVLQSDVSEEGPTKFTIKVQHLEDGEICILYAAHFSVLVTDPECDDSHAPDDPNFSILEALIAEVEEFDSDAEAFAIGTRGGVPVEEGDPAYHNNAKYYAESAGTLVGDQVKEAEAWARGTKDNVPVTSGDPQYNNHSKFYAEQAATSATNAATSESNASGSASAASGSASSASASSLEAEGYAKGTQGGTPVTSGSPYFEANAKYYKEQAATSATNAATSESNASGSASAASGSASSASASSLEAEGYAKGTQGGTPVTSGSPYYEANAKYYKEQAATSATNAATSEGNAATSETNARLSATAASGSANTASQKALDSEAWAVGQRNGQDVPATDPTYENNAKYWAQQAAQGQIQTDWSQTDNTQKDYIKNKGIVENAIAVNMIPHPYSQLSYDSNKVHMVANSDGSVTLYTAPEGVSQNVYINLVAASEGFIIPDGEYVVSCQGLVNNVLIAVQGWTKTEPYAYSKTYGATDVSDGHFTKGDGTTCYTRIALIIKSDTIIPEATPITIYPMLETGNTAHPYVPYIASGSHLNEVVKSVKDSIPAAQIQSDWNQADNSQPDYIKNKPTIPAAQVQSDWNQADNSKPDYIKNKPSFSASLSGLTDTNITTPTDGQVLKYDVQTQKWVNGNDVSGIAPDNVSDLSLSAGNSKVTIYWSDPADTVVDGKTICTWSHTKLVMKTGSTPSDENDGTLVTTNSVRDQYKVSGYEVTGLTNGTTYYFQLFPVSDGGAVNRNAANKASGTPSPTVTITITLTGAKEDTVVIKNSDAETVGTCIFESDATSGTFSVNVEPNYSDTWTFTSSVSGYIATATVTSTPSQSVAVLPSDVLYWHGVENVTFENGTYSDAAGVSTPSTVTISKGVNNIKFIANQVTTTNNMVRCGAKTTTSIDYTGRTTLKIKGTLNITYGSTYNNIDARALASADGKTGANPSSADKMTVVAYLSVAHDVPGTAQINASFNVSGVASNPINIAFWIYRYFTTADITLTEMYFE